MAKGDAVVDAQSIATASQLDFQPAAGVEVLIATIGMPASVNAQVYLYGGADIYAPVIADGLEIKATSGQVKILINNTTYLRIAQQIGSNQPLGYSGIQTK